MKQAVLVTMSVVLLGASAAPASGATRFAEPGGDGPAASCPRTNPCDVQVAVEDGSVAPGDEIVVLPGTYAIGADPLALVMGTEVGGMRRGPKPRIASNVPADAAISSAINAEGTRVHDLVIESTGPYGVSGIQKVERVRARAALTACSPMPYGAAFLRDSVCEGEGTGSRGVAYAVGCGEPNVIPPIEIRNVTAIATGTGAAALAVEVNGGCDSRIIGRNVIAMGEGVDLRVEADTEPGSRAEIDLNFSAFDSVEGGSANEFVSAPDSRGNITAEPILANPAAGNFRQLPGSPTIDAGRNTTMLGAFDFEGQRRVLGGRIDIGADEFHYVCAGRSATLLASPGTPTAGTGAADVIFGTPGLDVIRSRGGNDRVCGRGGNDGLKGGGGRDELFGEGGRDRLVGGPGRGDLCKGGPGRDRVAPSCERVR